MNNIYNSIKNNYNFSRKNRLNESKNILSLMIDSLQKQEKSLQRNLTNTEVIKNLNSFRKKLKEEIKFAKKSNNISLIKKIEFEISMVDKYIPAKLNEKETTLIIKEYISNNNITNTKQLGQVMDFLKNNYETTIDMKLASNIVKELLK